MKTIFVGYDSREIPAFEVACHSAACQANLPVALKPLRADELYRQRLLWRPVETANGVSVDHLSGAAQSTEFATSRFLVPFLQRSGWALFVDCDVVFLADVAELFALADPRYAVMVVQHDHVPRESSKMCGQPQSAYRRKNWSSVILWNCDHRANLRLTPEIVNGWRGSQLHQFCWLADEEIGALPPEWNWLVGVQEKPAQPKIAHFTLGGPWLPAWRGAPHDELWLAAQRAMVADQVVNAVPFLP